MKKLSASRTLFQPPRLTNQPVAVCLCTMRCGTHVVQKLGSFSTVAHGEA
jgi:hypothetical protein